MSKSTRRRFLSDLLGLGGALAGAAILAKNVPFFDQMLEGQACGQAGLASPHDSKPEHLATCRHPSDSDTHDFPIVTRRYPSDQDADVTPRGPSPPGPTSLTPFWSTVQG